MATKKKQVIIYDPIFKQHLDSDIYHLTMILISLRHQIESEGFNKAIFEKLLRTKVYGLKALLILTGFSNNCFRRLITIVRFSKDKDLCELFCTQHWVDKTDQVIQDWDDRKIYNLLETNYYFRKGIANLFVDGLHTKAVHNVLPPFELMKLGAAKVSFSQNSMIDTLVRCAYSNGNI